MKRGTVRLRCPQCRFVWDEERVGPPSPWVFLCPRCETMGERAEGSRPEWTDE